MVSAESRDCPDVSGQGGRSEQRSPARPSVLFQAPPLSLPSY